MSQRIGIASLAESWEQVLDFFLLFKQSQGLSDRTLDDYRHHVPRFFKSTSANLADAKELRLAVIPP